MMMNYLFRVVMFLNKCALTLGPKRIEVAAKRCANASLCGAMIELGFLVLESDYFMFVLDVVMLKFSKYCKRLATTDNKWNSETRTKTNKSIRDIIVRIRKFEAKYGI